MSEATNKQTNKQTNKLPNIPIAMTEKVNNLCAHLCLGFS